MARRIFLCLMILVAFALGKPASAREFTVDLSKRVVQITAGFHGTDLLIFGVAPGDGDIVVVVRGPQHDEIVRKKHKVVGVWINGEEITFEGVPSFYALASNRPLDHFLPGDVAAVQQIGLENILLIPKDEALRSVDPQTWSHFRHAFLRNKVAKGLYRSETGNLNFLGNRLFRTEVHFPANVSVGTFGIDVHLIRKGELVATETTLLNVRKFGIEASIFSFAHRYSFAYGVIAVIIAGFAGWAANAAFRKA